MSKPVVVTNVVDGDTIRVKYRNGVEKKVRLDYADCLGRLVQNDLTVARFYRRIDKTAGARLHADRALEVARASEDERLIEFVGANVCHAGIAIPGTGDQAEAYRRMSEFMAELDGA